MKRGVEDKNIGPLVTAALNGPYRYVQKCICMLLQVLILSFNWDCHLRYGAPVDDASAFVSSVRYSCYCARSVCSRVLPRKRRARVWLTTKRFIYKMVFTRWKPSWPDAFTARAVSASARKCVVSMWYYCIGIIVFFCLLFALWLHFCFICKASTCIFIFFILCI